MSQAGNGGLSMNYRCFAGKVCIKDKSDVLQSRVECIIFDKSTPTQISEMHKQTLPKQK